MIGDWFGADAAWCIPFEREARRKYRSRLALSQAVGHLTYTLVDIEVPGDAARHRLEIAFFRNPFYDTYGQPPQNAPLVRAWPLRESKHRFRGGALCLWQPDDPQERRWTSELGLYALIELAIRHLFMELHWLATGGRRGGEWILEDAPHGR